MYRAAKECNAINDDVPSERERDGDNDKAAIAHPKGDTALRMALGLPQAPPYAHTLQSSYPHAQRCSKNHGL